MNRAPAFAAGTSALAVGVAVYLADRPAGGAWLGAVGGWLPSLVHTFAFALFSAVLMAPAHRLRACGLWAVIGVLFEAGQHPALAPHLQGLPAPLARYFERGVFDPADIAATLAGALAAAGLLRIASGGLHHGR